MISRIYLSGSITNNPKYKVQFWLAEHFAKKHFNKIPINPSKIEDIIVEGTWEEYMKICISLMDLCDSILLLKGWEKSRGAEIELNYAISKGLNIYYEEEICGM